MKNRNIHDPLDWTGEPDVVAAAALAVALLVGAIGFLLVGAVASG